jgi:CheY-like chemotaxis protein
MTDSATLTTARVPTVYFIDDSATMREVIKIAFRKENVHVITCPDAASALAQFAEVAPDAVITDVIMPDKDGYEVCGFIKQHEQFAATPVILMSGVVNKTVAEKAMSVKADELIRKPFHPQDLIGRVKGLLASKFPSAASQQVAASAPPVSQTPSPFSSSAPSSAGTPALTNFFAPSPPASQPFAPPVAAPSAGPVANPRPAPVPQYAAPVAPTPAPAANGGAQRPATAAPVAPAPAPSASPAPSADVQKLRNEIRRLELLVKKLQADLEAARDYTASLEAHVKTLQD